LYVSFRERVRMVCKSAALFVIALTIGCASARYRVVCENLDCEDANEQVHRTLVGLTYEITRFDPATPGVQGIVEARRQTPDGLRYGRIRIDCGKKTVFQPVEGAWFLPTYDFSRDVYYALLAAVQLPQSPEIPPVSSGPETAAKAAPGSLRGKERPGGQLRIVFRPLGRFEVRKDTGIDLARRGLLVVRVVVVNGTTRAYILRAEQIVLVDEKGDRVGSLSSTEIEGRLRQSAAIERRPDEPPLPPIDIPRAVRTLEEKLLTSGRIGKGETRSGLLYFSEGDYCSGRMSLVDEETGEVEGTIVAF
jgi:hypothetical protein